jgi:hypothetical protein
LADGRERARESGAPGNGRQEKDDGDHLTLYTFTTTMADSTTGEPFSFSLLSLSQTCMLALFILAEEERKRERERGEEREMGF